MKKICLIILGISVLFIWGCSNISSNLNTEGINSNVNEETTDIGLDTKDNYNNSIECADDVIIFYAFSSYAMNGTDKATLERLKMQFSNLSFEPTEQNFDRETELRVIFTRNGNGISAFNVDKNGIFKFDRDINCYTISSGSFDYEFVREVYSTSKYK